MRISDRIFSTAPVTKLCLATVIFGLALLSRLGAFIDPSPHGRMESWSVVGFFLALCCWFLLQQWLDKRDGMAAPAKRPTEWGQRSELPCRARGVGVCLVILSCVGVARAADNMQFGEWTVNVTDNKQWVYGATSNDSGSVFGEYCSLETGKCNWLLGLDKRCTSDASYPVLANSKAGSAQLTVVCAGPVSNNNQAPFYQYVFTDWKTLESLIKNSDRVGFAFPMQADQFIVVRFSMNGLQQATETAEGLASKASAKSTTNQVL